MGPPERCRQAGRTVPARTRPPVVPQLLRPSSRHAPGQVTFLPDELEEAPCRILKEADKWKEALCMRWHILVACLVPGPINGRKPLARMFFLLPFSQGPKGLGPLGRAQRARPFGPAPLGRAQRAGPKGPGPFGQAKSARAHWARAKRRKITYGSGRPVTVRLEVVPGQYIGPLSTRAV